MADIVLVEGNNVLNVGLTPIPVVASLYGVVTDIETGEPIGGVKVTIDGIVTYTNASGAYGFEGLTPGGYTITFEKDGYETVIK
ncbi:hypothetical protein ES704_02712 [subsurface metagenome]|jgi:hypothetical protein